jgi:hypothetical protein
MAADYACCLMAGEVEGEAELLHAMEAMQYVVGCGGWPAVPAAVSRLIEALEPSPGEGT